MSSGHPETRKKILEAAWKILEARSGREVRMSDIAREAGVSRQALYLHFPTRAELLIATTRHIDEVKGSDRRLARSRAATSGPERLDAFIEAWAAYIPEVYGVARALMAMGETDDAARQVWNDRLQAIREGCEAAVEAIARDGLLVPDHSVEQATDLLWALLSVRTWEMLTIDRGWPQELYAEKMKVLARRMLIAGVPAG